MEDKSVEAKEVQVDINQALQFVAGSEITPDTEMRFEPVPVEPEALESTEPETQPLAEAVEEVAPAPEAEPQAAPTPVPTSEEPASQIDEILSYSEDQLLAILRGQEEVAEEGEAKPPESAVAERVPWRQEYIKDRDFRLVQEPDGSFTAFVKVPDKQGRVVEQKKTYKDLDALGRSFGLVHLEGKRAEYDAEYLREKLEQASKQLPPTAPGSPPEISIESLLDIGGGTEQGRQQPQSVIDISPLLQQPGLSYPSPVAPQPQAPKIAPVVRDIYGGVQAELQQRVKNLDVPDNVKQEATDAWEDEIGTEKIKAYRARELDEDENRRVVRIWQRKLKEAAQGWANSPDGVRFVSERIQAGVQQSHQAFQGLLAQASSVLGKQAETLIPPVKNFIEHYYYAGGSPRTPEEVALSRVADNVPALMALAYAGLQAKKVFTAGVQAGRKQAESEGVVHLRKYLQSRGGKAASSPAESEAARSRMGSPQPFSQSSAKAGSVPSTPSRKEAAEAWLRQFEK